MLTDIRCVYLSRFPFGGIALRQDLKEFVRAVNAEIDIDMERIPHEVRKKVELAFQRGYLAAAKNSTAAAIYEFFCLKHHVPVRIVANYKALCTTTQELWSRHSGDFAGDLRAVHDLKPSDDITRRERRYGDGGIRPVVTAAHGFAVSFIYPNKMSADALLSGIGAELFPRPPQEALDAALSDFLTAKTIRVGCSSGR